MQERKNIASQNKSREQFPAFFINRNCLFVNRITISTQNKFLKQLIVLILPNKKVKYIVLQVKGDG